MESPVCYEINGKKRCVNFNHNLIIRQTYSVIIICKDCNLIDSFNLIN